MLEAEGVLWTWRLESEPVPENCRAGINATRLPNHRVHYLDYEGPVSGNRGSVQRWDFGLYEINAKSNEFICVVIEGKKLNGEMQLRQQEGDLWRFQSSES